MRFVGKGHHMGLINYISIMSRNVTLILIFQISFSLHRVGHSLCALPRGDHHHQRGPLRLPLLRHQVAGSHHRPHRALGRALLSGQGAEGLLRLKVQAILPDAAGHCPG